MRLSRYRASVLSIFAQQTCKKGGWHAMIPITNAIARNLATNLTHAKIMMTLLIIIIIIRKIDLVVFSSTPL